MKKHIFDLIPNLRSIEINKDEFEKIVRDTVKERTNKHIDNLEYNDNGISIILSDGDFFDIEVDWNEIIIK